MKLDSAGNIQWQKSLGGPGSEVAVSIDQTLDGGYIIAGFATSNGGDVTGYHYSGPWPVLMYDCWVVKLDSTGNIEWEKCLGGSGVSDAAFSVQQTTDGGFIVGGETNSTDGDVYGLHGSDEDFWVIKLDPLGNISWQKCLGGTGGDAIQSLQQTNDRGYILAGFSNSTDGDVTGNHGGSADYWVVKIDTVGTIQWQQSFGGSGLDVPSSIQQTSDGGYFIAGNSYSVDGDITGHHGLNSTSDYWIVKLDSVGSIQWEKSLGGTQDEYDCYGNVTDDGGYIVAGPSQSIDGDITGHRGAVNSDDSWVVKLDTNGNIEWQKSIGGSGEERSSYLQQTYDGGYITGGYSSSNDWDVTGNHGGIDGWVVKLIECNQAILTVSHNGDTLSANTPEINYQWYHNDSLIIGATSENYVINDSGNYYVTTSSDGCVVTSNIIATSCLCVGTDESTLFQSISLFPNPANESITITVKLSTAHLASIKLTDATGRTVFEKAETLQAISFNWEITVSDYASGIYFAEIAVPGQTQYHKVAVQR